MIKVIFFDFDGVILDSMAIRDKGFKEIFSKHPKKIINQLIAYHRHNAGLSRFHKIKYLYNVLLKSPISEEEVQKYANRFSQIMRSRLTDKRYLITSMLKFIKKNQLKYTMHIVSGSEQNELQFLCKQLNISKYFDCIYGSPTHKNILVKNILDLKQHNLIESILIGDSINDYEAAKNNGIDFYGFNNEDLKTISKEYINDPDKILL